MSKVKSFKGTNIYVGIDVHLKSWRVALFTDKTALKKFSVSPPDVDSLANTLDNLYPGANFFCGYEAGFSGFLVTTGAEQQRVFHHSGKCG